MSEYAVLQYLNHVRVLLSIYLRTGQFDKAESLLAENSFRETGVFWSGLFACVR